MADQEQNKNEDLENIEPILDEDSFSLDLDDFDMGDDDLDVSPGIEAPNLDDISAFDDEDDSISDMVASSDSYDDLLDIDLDSDLNLLGEEDPILHDEDIHADFSDYEEESEKENSKSPAKQSYNDSDDEDLELEFDDDLIDLDKEIESILNGEDGILSSKKSKQNLEDEEEGPISLSLEELENITGNLEEEDHLGESEHPHFDEEDHENDLINEHSDLDLDLDDSEIDTNLAFDEEGKPQFDLTDHDEEDSFIPKDDLGPGTDEEDSEFKPLVDPEEEELFGKNKEDENLTLSDEELGSILGAGGEASLEETLGSEDEFLASDEEADLPSFSDEEGGFDLLGGEFETPEEEPTLEEDEDEGPLTLSLEELENISGEAIEEDFEEPTSDILNEELEDESITLSPDELGNIIASDPIEESEDSDISEIEDIDELETDLGDDFGFDLGDTESELEESESSEEGLEGQMEGFESSEEEDEGPIALSMEELESIASDAEESSEEELVDSFDRAPLPYEEELTPKSDLMAEDEEDESIALSMEELENITASDEEDVEEEDVTLSPESLDEILGEELPGEGLEDIADLPVEEEFSLSEQVGDDDNLVELEPDMDFGDFTSDSSADDSFDLSVPDLSNETRTPTLASDESEEFEVDLDEYAMEGKLSPLEELRKSDVSAPEEKPSSAEEAFVDAGGENLSVGDRKKVLGYLDNLLGNLPDEVIREFSKSQYFELYKKMMKELEL